MATIKWGVIVALLGYDFFIGIAPNKKNLKNFMVGVQNFRK